MSKAGARDNAAPATTPRTTTRRSRRSTSSRFSRSTRTFPASGLLRGGLQDRGARHSRRVQQEQRRTRSGSCSRCSATTTSRRTPTSTRPWASSPTSRTCRTSTSTRRCSSSAGTARSSRRSSWPATSRREQVLPMVEKYWGGWKPGRRRRRRSRRSRRRRGRSTSTCRGRATRCRT